MNDDREIIRLYTQLIQAVDSNESGESRHQTAMRYIEEGKQNELTLKGGE
jgi:hypothetical protein